MHAIDRLFILGDDVVPAPLPFCHSQLLRLLHRLVGHDIWHRRYFRIEPTQYQDGAHNIPAEVSLESGMKPAADYSTSAEVKNLLICSHHSDSGLVTGTDGVECMYDLSNVGSVDRRGTQGCV